MSMTASFQDRPHHPWLEAFLRAPVAEFGDLLAGFARIPPYERADAPDAARMLFGPLDADDPARRALGPAILGWLEQRRRQAPPLGLPGLQSWVREVCEAFEIVTFLGVADAAAELRRRRVIWTDWTSDFVLAPSRDARAEFWRMLALTQPLLEPAEGSLAPIWMDICRQAGGALPQRYLNIGLLGLRRLPGAGTGSEEPFMAGLAQWAMERNPSDAAFKGEWLALKPFYPRTPARWRELVWRLLNTKEFQDRDIKPPAWWACDAEIAPIGAPHFSIRGAALRSPGPRDCDGVIEELSKSWTAVEPQVDRLMESHRRFLKGTGDGQFFVRAIHSLGTALIETPADHPQARARKAQALALEGLEWEPYNRHLWSLWRDALVAEGALDAAEQVGWEAIRRDPDHVDARNQLATLLAGTRGRPAEAEALLRDTIAAFPRDPVARTQLAELLIAADRIEDAETTVADAFAAEAENEVTYVLRARLESHRGHIQDAEATLREGRNRFPSDTYLPNYQRMLANGEPLPLKSAAHRRSALPVPHAAPSLMLADTLPFAELRRLRFQATHGHEQTALERVRAILADNRTFAYAQLLAARHGLWHPDPNTLPSFAVAFEQALRDEDRAKLDDLAQRQPRLHALTLVARALLGDTQAANLVHALSAGPEDKNEARAVTYIRHVLRPLLQSAPAPSVFQDNAPFILERLRDAIESTFGDRLAA